MKDFVAHRVRLDPTDEERSALARVCGVVRLVKRLAVDQRRTFSRRGRPITRGMQSSELKELRAEWPWIGEIAQDFLAQALIDVETAYSRFFSGLSGAPRPPRRSDASFRFPVRTNRGRVLEGGRLWIPKLGQVKVFFASSDPGRGSERYDLPRG